MPRDNCSVYGCAVSLTLKRPKRETFSIIARDRVIDVDREEELTFVNFFVDITGKIKSFFMLQGKQ